MRGKGKDVENMAQKRKDFLEKAYELFSAKNIESVSLQDIADASGYGIATLYRYFVNKPTLVVETAALKWGQFTEGLWARLDRDKDAQDKSSEERFGFYLDTFLELYRDQKALLRFNQFFNIYIQAEEVDQDMLRPYGKMLMGIKDRFHEIYAKAQEDKLIRTDETEQEMLSATLHIMMAAVTRYAVGLVYEPEGFDAQRELLKLKSAIMREYKAA